MKVGFRISQALWWVLACGAASAALVAFAPARASDAVLPPGHPDGAILSNYCFGCHNDKRKVGGLVLENKDLTHVGPDADTWEKVVRKLRMGSMPPPGLPRPDLQTTDNFVVSIDDAWMNDDHLWTIPMKIGSSSLDVEGTRIVVSQLPPGISRLFSDETDFVEDLEKAIASYYSVILDKGFAVTVNTVPVRATQTAILMDSIDFEKATGIMPYVYHAEEGGVVVTVVVGFYRDLPSEEEEEQALEGKPSVEKAGITVVCNDRVVLYADKSRLTGWGESTVPQYHTQFVSIAGLVTFNANDASLLPITTTKRGLDGNSELYLMVKENIREGIKFFTDFTNKWKKSKRERASFQQKAQAVLPAMIAERVPQNRRSSVHKGIGGWKYKPQLPLPTEDDPMRQVRFSRKQSEIATVAKYLFDDVSIAPGAVGDKCFDDALKRAGKR